MPHHCNLGIELTQREIVGHDLRRQNETGVLEVCFRLLRGGARTFDLAAHAAKQVGFVVHVRAQHEIVLHGRLIGQGVAGERTIRRRFAALRLGGQAHGGVQIRGGDAGLTARLIEPRGGDSQVLIVGERTLDQRIQSRVLEKPPPLSLQRAVIGRGFMPRSIGVPGGRHIGLRPVVVGTHRAAGDGRHRGGRRDGADGPGRGPPRRPGQAKCANPRAFGAALHR